MILIANSPHPNCPGPISDHRLVVAKVVVAGVVGLLQVVSYRRHRIRRGTILTLESIKQGTST